MEPGTAAYFSIPLLVLEELGMPLFLSTERNMTQKANLKYKKVQQLEFLYIELLREFHTVAQLITNSSYKKFCRFFFFYSL